MEVPRLQHNKTLVILGLTDPDEDVNTIDFSKLTPVTNSNITPSKTVDSLINEIKPKKKIALKKMDYSFNENDEIETKEEVQTFVFESMKDFDYSNLSNPAINSKNIFFKEQVAIVKCLKEITEGMGKKKFIADLTSGNLERFLNNLI